MPLLLICSGGASHITSSSPEPTSSLKPPGGKSKKTKAASAATAAPTPHPTVVQLTDMGFSKKRVELAVKALCKSSWPSKPLLRH